MLSELMRSSTVEAGAPEGRARFVSKAIQLHFEIEKCPPSR
jgi:hypothetical protein